jgi:hypothetical protein
VRIPHRIATTAPTATVVRGLEIAPGSSTGFNSHFGSAATLIAIVA